VELVLVRLYVVSYARLLLWIEPLYLKIAELGELLAAVVQSASEGLDLLMDDLVRTNVPTLRKGFTTNVALIRAFTSVASLMSLVGIVRCV
jgi:hypothetical protein